MKNESTSWGEYIEWGCFLTLFGLAGIAIVIAIGTGVIQSLCDTSTITGPFTNAGALVELQYQSSGKNGNRQEFVKTTTHQFWVSGWHNRVKKGDLVQYTNEPQCGYNWVCVSGTCRPQVAQ